MTHQIGDTVEVPAKTMEVRITHDFIDFDRMTRAQQEEHLREVHGYDWPEFHDPASVHHDDHDEYFTGGGLTNHVHNKPAPLTPAEVDTEAEALYMAEVKDKAQREGPVMYLGWRSISDSGKARYRDKVVAQHRKRG